MKKMTKAMTRANNMVVRVVMCLITISIFVTTLSSCTNDDESEAVKKTTEGNILVDLSFSPYEMTPMTRTATSIADVCSRLDVWITDEDGDETVINQSSEDDGFGTLSVSLNKTKTYTLVAVAHKCSEPATLDDGIISFPDDKVTHAMVYATTFSPSTTTSLSCQMQRIVAMLRLEITDAVPDEVTKFVYSIPDTYNRWSTDGTAANQIDRTGTINITSRNNDGSVNLTIYIMPSALNITENLNITFSAQTADGDVIEEHLFEDVPVRAGYKTTYRGTFFVTTAETATFTVEDWNSFDTVTY